VLTPLLLLLLTRPQTRRHRKQHWQQQRRHSAKSRWGPRGNTHTGARRGGGHRMK